MRRLPLALIAACLAWPASASPASPARHAQLAMVSFNVLAPVWAAPDWYPPQMDMSLLDAGFRRDRITAFLAARAATTDVFCLQEVQESELPAFLVALGGGFTGAMAHNDPDCSTSWPPSATASRPIRGRAPSTARRAGRSSIT